MNKVNIYFKQLKTFQGLFFFDTVPGLFCIRPELKILHKYLANQSPEQIHIDMRIALWLSFLHVDLKEGVD